MVFTKHLQPSPLIYAPMPKTACNTLSKRLQACFDVNVFSTKSGGGIGHFTIDPFLLMQANRTIFTRKIPFIFQHFMPTNNNRHKLCAHLNLAGNPKVIVSVRNIYDVAVSSADHQRTGKSPFYVVKEELDFLDAGGVDEHAYIWNTILCLKFYASWAIAARSGMWDVKFVDFENIVTRPVETIEEIAAFYGLDFKADGVSNADLDKIRDNVNKGQSGRGVALDPYYKELLSRFVATYKADIDFSLVGL